MISAGLVRECKAHLLGLLDDRLATAHTINVA